mgnify:CR=1 FL=1
MLPAKTVERAVVSIHASAREATIRPSSPAPHFLWFQSTPPHGRRPVRILAADLPGLFQSTPPHGRRLALMPCLRQRVTVSIHASAREATHTTGKPSTRQLRFNPRLRTGGDLVNLVNGHGRERFNPRLRTGGDLSPIQKMTVLEQFQSTPPHGRRHVQFPDFFWPCGVSIHASAREAT